MSEEREQNRTEDIMRIRHLVDRLRYMHVIMRYANSPLPDIMSLVFILYAFYLGVRVDFDGEGRLLGYDGDNACADDILSRLYAVTSSQLVGGKCREGEELWHGLAALQDSIGDFRMAIPRFIETYILDRPGVHGSPSYPRYLERTVISILESEKASSVYESGSGLGLFARSYDGWERYFAYEPGRIDMLLAELLQKLKGKKEVFYTSHDYLLRTPEALRGFDTIIKSLLPPEGGSALSRFMQNNIRIDLNGLLESLFSLDSWKRVILVVDNNVCCGPEYMTARSRICSRGLLHSVTRVEVMTRSGKEKCVFVLLLNRDANTSVIFNSKSPRIPPAEIPVKELEVGCYVLEPDLYYHRGDGPAAYLPGDVRESYDFEKEGDTDAVLGDMVEFVPSESPFSFHEEAVGSPRNILGIDKEDFGKAAFSAVRPKKPHDLDGGLGYRLVNGPAVHILFDGGWPCSVCRVDDAVKYLVPEEALSFSVKDGTDPSYLIASLFLNESLSINVGGLKRMVLETDYGNLPKMRRINLSEEYLFDILASRPVRIISGRKRQADFMQGLLSAMGDVVNSDREYGVVLVGKPLTDGEKAMLPGWLINVVGETDGIEGLRALIASDREKPLRSVDAVIMDTMTGYDEGHEIRYKGLFEGQKLSSPELPFIFYSGFGTDSLGPLGGYIFTNLTSWGNRFAVKTEKESLREAVRALRDYLDSRSSPDAAIRKKYAREIGIADRIDPEGLITATLVESMRDDFSFGDNLMKTEEKFGELRKRAEKIFNDAKEVRMFLPPMKLGQLQQLLSDGEYYDNNTGRMYRLTAPVMPETLSYAFGYLVKVTNGGTHEAGKDNLDVGGYVTATRSPNIYKTCVFILMDLLIWYGELRETHGGPLYEECVPFREDDVVKRHGANYYYIGNVHLRNIPGLREGIPGRLISLDGLGRERKDVPDGLDIRYFADRYRIGQQ